MSNDMLTMVGTALAGQTEQANALATRIAAATTDRSKALHDYMTDPESTDPDVKAFQEYEEKMLAALEEQREILVGKVEAKIGTVSPEDVETLKTQYKGIVDQIKAARKFAATIPGYTDETFKDVPALKNLRGSTAGKGGSGGKRPRLVSVEFRASTKDEWTEAYTTREGKDGEDVRVSNFTVLAGALKDKFGTKVEVKELQTAAFEAAGTDDLNTLEGKTFEFATSVGDKTVFVKVTPKHSDAE